MKEIGESFREAREHIGLSKEEVIKDLNITINQLDNLEDGNSNAFKDVFFLKDLIKKYAKYLNLDEDEIMDKYNDFIFNFTSKIPVNDILEQTREIEIIEKQNDENKIISPYTKKIKSKNTGRYVIIYILSILVVIFLVFIIVRCVMVDELVNLDYLVERSVL